MYNVDECAGMPTSTPSESPPSNPTMPCFMVEIFAQHYHARTPKWTFEQLIETGSDDSMQSWISTAPTIYNSTNNAILLDTKFKCWLRSFSIDNCQRKKVFARGHLHFYYLQWSAVLQCRVIRKCDCRGLWARIQGVNIISGPFYLNVTTFHLRCVCVVVTTPYNTLMDSIIHFIRYFFNEDCSFFIATLTFYTKQKLIPIIEKNGC